MAQKPLRRPPDARPLRFAESRDPGEGALDLTTARPVVRDTTLTLRPSTLKAFHMMRADLCMSPAALVNHCLRAFSTWLIANPQNGLQNKWFSCPHCGHVRRPQIAREGRRRQLHVAMTNQDVEMLNFIADNYFAGVYSRALEAAIIYTLPAELLPKGRKKEIE